MALKNSQYDQIIRDYDQRRLHHKNELDERIKIAYQKIPRLDEIDQEIASVSIQKAKYLLGEDVADLDLNDSLASLSEERAALLSMNGFPEDYLQMHYDCPHCQDTGYNEGEKCSCFKKATADLLYAQSNLGADLKKNNFSTFNLDYYSNDSKDSVYGESPRAVAENALRYAQKFTTDFKDTPGNNLLILGNTGVGKTFLSRCIAKDLIDKGCLVIYFSATELFDQLAKSTFTKNPEAMAINELIYDCDLLIIDDLGTELTNSFVNSSLFLCINERLMRHKSTIISTNISIDDFPDIYSDRIFSRISSNYTMLELLGDDIRLQIQKERLGGRQ